MTNVAHNGFGCPYCRTEMAEEQVDSDDEEDGDYEETRWTGGQSAYFTRLNEDHALRGMRWLFQQQLADGEEEEEEEEDDDVVEIGEEEDITPKPSLRYLTQKLTQQGVTMEQLVKTLLLEHEEYANMDEECTRASNELFGKIRIVVSNYDADDELPKDTPPMSDFIADRFLRVV
jgi:hypothetical protein